MRIFLQWLKRQTYRQKQRGGVVVPSNEYRLHVGGGPEIVVPPSGELVKKHGNVHGKPTFRVVIDDRVGGYDYLPYLTRRDE